MIPDIVTIPVPTMKNPTDEAAIRKAIESLPGVLMVETDPGAGLVHVTHDTGMLPEHAIHGTIESAGYPTVREP